MSNSPGFFIKFALLLKKPAKFNETLKVKIR